MRKGKMKQFNSKSKELALVTAFILHEGILNGTVFQTFDRAYEIAEKFIKVYPADFTGWEDMKQDFDEVIIEFANKELRT